MPAAPALHGLTLLERGWLSSNNVLLHGAPGEGATLVDSGHCAHAQQTLALVRHGLGDEPLARIVNTHLHSDHCGGNATLQRAFAATPVVIPPGQWDAVQRWDEDALSYRPTRQRCERFTADAVLAPGATLRCGGRAWEVLAAPGHDPHSVILFDAAHGVLISADALWESGFGVVFPELDGVGAYDDVAAVLDLIERLPVQWVLPGHGAPFEDVAADVLRLRARANGALRGALALAPSARVRSAGFGGGLPPLVEGFRMTDLACTLASTADDGFTVLGGAESDPLREALRASSLNVRG